MSGEPVNLFDLTRERMVAFTSQVDDKPYRTHQIMKWAYHQRSLEFDRMTNLSKAFRAWLAERAVYRLPEVVSRRESVDGTIKWVVRVGNGNCVETVLIPDRGRNTLCVSSQVGCMLDCAFCSTGKQGFNGNLTTGEIIGQVWLANDLLVGKGETVSNVVLMGMGEPLLNFDAVVAATEIMMDDLAFGISKRRVTISTAGVVPAIYELAKVSDVSLAVSLHAPTDELRSQLVPLNRKYPIAMLLDACRHYVEGLGERRALTMEYTLIKGVNDDLSHAKRLGRLLEGVRCKINLIPFNPFPASGLERPDMGAVRKFQTCLMDMGYATMLRTTRGEDIDAACGQLVGQVQDRTRRQMRYLARVRAERETEALPAQGEAQSSVGEEMA
ncbi:MAG: 23S rRNA (adenine(2503)-C(2))-methyltransferase RlmN [Gammaproteobacteria bacterium]